VIYLDTSALIKRYVDERGSPGVHQMVATGPVATSKIAYAELYAGLARKVRQRQLTARDRGTAARQFEHDWQACIRINVLDEILALARDLVARHPLRGFDALHLASALYVAKESGQAVTFAAADSRLVRAARAERLTAVNPEAGTED
jgi:predicted nucleic acid-binding protein